MRIASQHNLHRPLVEGPKPYGISVKLRPGDPFLRLLGEDWRKLHWYATAAERDAALLDMSRRHEFSRQGDEPALRFDKIEKLAESRSRD
jgi:hypothetical protein